MYHTSEPNDKNAVCPFTGVIPKKPFSVHLHNNYGPPKTHEPYHPPFSAFAWVVIKKEDENKFVMVNEPTGLCRGSKGPSYWLPAGRVDEGETFVEAAKREAMEEAGIEVEITGVLHFMLSGSCPRIVFQGQPTTKDAICKTVPNYESVGAIWVSAQDLDRLNTEDYRSPDPVKYFPRIANGSLKA